MEQYVLLQSDDQPPSDFLQKLNPPLHLTEGEWEVAVTQVILPRNWNTLDGDDCHFTIGKNEKQVLCTIPSQRYTSVDDVIYAMKASMPVEYRSKVEMGYVVYQNKLRYSLLDGVWMSFNEPENNYLRIALGIGPNEKITGKGE